MNKWPEKKEIDRILYDPWVNRHKEGWNACHDAFTAWMKEQPIVIKEIDQQPKAERKLDIHNLFKIINYMRNTWGIKIQLIPQEAAYDVVNIFNDGDLFESNKD